MNGWKQNKSWILVWGSSLLVIGLIFYIRYQSFLVKSTLEKAGTIKTVQTVSAAVPVSEQPKEKSENQNVSEGQRVKPSPEDSAKPQKALDIGDFPSPVQGKVLRGIGNYYSEALGSYLFHGGIDYTEREGTVIRVTHGGKVVFAGSDPILGQKVTLDCGEGWIVTYGGLENLSVKIGEDIERMDKIGQVGFVPGAEGCSGQSQLHYEVWHNNKVQSPG